VIVLFSVIVLHWMTSRDQDNQPPTACPEDPPSRPRLVARLSGAGPQSPRIFDFDGTIDTACLDSRISAQDFDGVVSMAMPKESQSNKTLHNKGESINKSVEMFDDEVVGVIVKRTSLTMESVRDEDSNSDEAIPG
jgi:hypothetical protein